MSSMYKVFVPTFLYIKQHKVTGKLYFGKTYKNPEKYTGSGVHWKPHLRKHGKNIETLWYCLYLNEESIKESAMSFSKLWNIVESDEWLNLIEENGTDGGDTISHNKNRKIITEKISKKLKKCLWWNNGINQCFLPEPPDNSYNPGRLPFNNSGAQIGANIQKQKIWINNGTKEIMVLPQNILLGYSKGRLTTKAFAGGEKRHSTKGSKWWTNGQQCKMSTISPGPEWKLGRIINPTNHHREQPSHQ